MIQSTDLRQDGAVRKCDACGRVPPVELICKNTSVFVHMPTGSESSVVVRGDNLRACYLESDGSDAELEALLDMVQKYVVARKNRDAE